jgi:hypothetical protein
MDVGEVKTRYFKRDSEKADQLTLYPHKEAEFWYWVNTWAVFLQSPADLGFDATGYELPPLRSTGTRCTSTIRAAGFERDGQAKLLRDSAIGVQDAAAVKRATLTARIAKVRELDRRSAERSRHRLARPGGRAPRARGVDSRHRHRVRRAGSRRARGGHPRLRRRSLARIGAKPVMLGSGVNFQRHCHWAIFAGIGFKFSDFIQAIHRVWRYLQPGEVTIDIIFADAETEVRRSLEAKWKRHEVMMARMAEIIREYGLNSVDAREKLVRSIGVTATWPRRSLDRGPQRLRRRMRAMAETRSG